MVGRKKVARSLSKWLGSLGKYGEPPIEYFILEAAKELGMSYAELEARGDRERLMTIAFTISQGKTEGEHTMQCNPEFIAIQKKKSKEIEKANGKAGK